MAMDIDGAAIDVVDESLSNTVKQLSSPHCTVIP